MKRKTENQNYQVASISTFNMKNNPSNYSWVHRPNMNKPWIVSTRLLIRISMIRYTKITMSKRNRRTRHAQRKMRQKDTLTWKLNLKKERPYSILRDRRLKFGKLEIVATSLLLTNSMSKRLSNRICQAWHVQRQKKKKRQAELKTQPQKRATKDGSGPPAKVRKTSNLADNDLHDSLDEGVEEQSSSQRLSKSSNARPQTKTIKLDLEPPASVKETSNHANLVAENEDIKSKLLAALEKFTDKFTQSTMNKLLKIDFSSKMDSKFLHNSVALLVYKARTWWFVIRRYRLQCAWGRSSTIGFCETSSHYW